MKTQEEIKQLAEDYSEISFNKRDLYEGYVDGYTQCQEDMINKWIEFKKQPPPIPSENYLVFKNGEIKISLFRGDWNMFHCDINRNINEPYVTHWAEIPAKPNLK